MRLGVLVACLALVSCGSDALNNGDSNSAASSTQSTSGPSSAAPAESSQADFDAALNLIGAAVEVAPPAAVQLTGAAFCGWDRLGGPSVGDPVIDSEARTCFVDAHRAGQSAVFVAETRDNEGNPVPIIFRTSDGQATMYWDWTRSFSSEDWRTEPCDVLYVEEQSDPVAHLVFSCTAWDGAAPA